MLYASSIQPGVRVPYEVCEDMLVVRKIKKKKNKKQGQSSH
jgi:hypothetical protein